MFPSPHVCTPPPPHLPAPPPPRPLFPTLTSWQRTLKLTSSDWFSTADFRTRRSMSESCKGCTVSFFVHAIAYIWIFATRSCMEEKKSWMMTNRLCQSEKPTISRMIGQEQGQGTPKRPTPTAITSSGRCKLSRIDLALLCVISPLQPVGFPWRFDPLYTVAAGRILLTFPSTVQAGRISLTLPLTVHRLSDPQAI